MKIVQINSVYEYGSTGKIVSELHRALKNTGYDSFVFCSNYKDVDHNIFCIGSSLSKIIHSILSRFTGLQGYFSFIATYRLLRNMDEIIPDVVHLHNLHSNYINVNMVLDYLSEKQIPTIITLHDCWLFTGHCCHYTQDACDRWINGCGKCPSIHKWNKSWFFDTSSKIWKDRKDRFGNIKSLTVVGVSDWITNEAKKSIFKRNAKFKRIYNWIDLNIFMPQKKKEKNEVPLILSVAQGWSEKKGLYDILHVADELPEFRFVLIGDHPNIKVPDNVEFIGKISKTEQLVVWYQKADVYLHLSYQETFGKVIAEALACGTPAVVYNVTAMPELIGPGCGCTVKIGDWKAAKQEIVRILRNPELFDQARTFAEKEFDIKKLTKEWISLYLSVSNREEN